MIKSVQNNGILWEPDLENIANAEVSAFMQELGKKGVRVDNYAQLYDWSISNSEDFWSYYWDFTNIIG